MAKIIEHNFSGKAGRPGRDLLTASYGRQMQQVEEMKQLLGELVMQARLFLEQEGMDPREFVLSGMYLKEFLFTHLDAGRGEEGDYGELVYLNCREERILAVCQFAVPKAEGLMISYRIYSLDSPDRGNRVWKLYDFLSGRWIEDGEDCFDLSMVLYEYGLSREKKD